MSLMPMALYGLEVSPDDAATYVHTDFPAAVRITMAAIDPTADAAGEEDTVPRATLRIIRQPLLAGDGEDDSDDDSEDFDADEMERILLEEEEDDEDEHEGINGGPSDPEKSRKVRQNAAEKALKKALKDDMFIDDEDMPNGVNGANGTVVKSAKAKGKMPASDEDEDEDDDEDDDVDQIPAEVESFVVCTLDPNKNYQQPLDLTIGEDERVWFHVAGTHSIYLTGNYVEPTQGNNSMYDPDSDEEEDYDLEPDDDELDGLEEGDELDDLADPRLMELDDEDTETAPDLVKTNPKKQAKKQANQNKRPAPESADEDDAEGGAETLDNMILKEASKPEPAVNGDQKLSKKQMKKLKKNDGTAAAATEKVEAKKETEAPSSAKSDKKVSFAKNLEQGPNPNAAKDKTADQGKDKSSLGMKVIQGVTIDDRKLGTGQAAKNGDRLSMRYIGKLDKDKKVFDSNKKGKPFSFKLGAGDVIKGWEIGALGICAGGERRITIPPHLGYGSKGMPGIPANSTLVFDIKALEVNKGK